MKAESRRLDNPNTLIRVHTKNGIFFICKLVFVNMLAFQIFAIGIWLYIANPDYQAKIRDINVKFINAKGCFLHFNK